MVAGPEVEDVAFEAAGWRPTLDVQRYAREADQEDELRKGLVKATRQFARFLHRAGNGAVGLEEFAGLERCILAVVMYEPFPFHCVPDLRQMIERLAAEIVLGIPIESQLEQFARYRESARRVERWEGGLPVFPRHLEEFLQEQFNNSRRIANPLCQSVWESFCAFAQRRIFDEDIEITEREIRELTTRRLAYELWERRGRPLWDDLTDWHQAELILGFAE